MYSLSPFSQIVVKVKSLLDIMQIKFRPKNCQKKKIIYIKKCCYEKQRDQMRCFDTQTRKNQCIPADEHQPQTKSTVEII